MSRKFKITLMAFTPMPTRMGVRVSPAARRTVPKITEAVRGSMGR